MKTTRLLLVLCVAMLALSACSKSDEPTPPPPVPEEEFKDVNESMENHINDETPGCYCNYFLFQNGSDHTLWFYVVEKYGAPQLYYLRPKEQATHLFTEEFLNLPGYDMGQVRYEDLGAALGWIYFYFNAPAPGEFEPIVGSDNGLCRTLEPEFDTLATYSYFEKLEYNSPKKTPRDPSQWKFEKFTDRRLRWTYRVTNEDHDEAVRQTLERWKDKPKKE